MIPDALCVSGWYIPEYKVGFPIMRAERLLHPILMGSTLDPSKRPTFQQRQCCLSICHHRAGFQCPVDLLMWRLCVI
jgi:hypothetical protein